MKIVILGLGYVGCTALACIASQGHTVVGIDPSAKKVAAIAAGRSPIHEPQVGEMIAAGTDAGLVTAQTEVGEALDGADLAIVCVGTPSGPDGAHNMGYIVQVTRQIAAALPAGRARPLTVVYRSTMRPGSIEQLIVPIFRSTLGDDWATQVELVYNPEFLRESTAVQDYFAPPKIVVGTIDGEPSATVEALHDGIEAPTFHVRLREAEVTKFVDNTWHAVKVAFANEIGRVCETLGISATQVHRIFVADEKLNLSAYYTRPGGPFGGSCLPKDVRALQHIAGDVGVKAQLIKSLIRSNEAHKDHQFEMVAKRLPPGGSVLLVGLAFKQHTDDLRESPAVDLAAKLLDAGYRLRIYDPSLRPADFVGQNLGYAYGHLPSIDQLLADRAEAEGGGFDLVVATNRLIDTLTPGATQVIDLSRTA